jgi:serine protease AprX
VVGISAMVLPLAFAGSAHAATAAAAATSTTVVSTPTPAAATAGLIPGLLGTVGGVVTTTVTGVTGLVGALLNPWGDTATDKVALGSDGVNHPEKDPGSLYTLTNVIGARAVWAQTDSAGKAITGKGITVAELDSGVSPVVGLDAKGKVVNGPDLSLETNSAQLRNLDSFGHGTHLAGIIAAHDTTASTATGAPVTTSPTQQLGVAPDAQLLAVKLATADGSTDVSQIIAALDWVTQHRNDGPSRIRVINLAFGTDSVQSYQIDPLAAAVENAWRAGIVVVVSGGNEGNKAGRLTDPAIDPYVIAVGSSDPNHSVAGWTVPSVSTFSNSGTAQRHVDLVAPGASIASLRDPGSNVDVNHPEGLVSGDKSGRLFRGSGTSQASAVVSGAAALLLQENPNLTPDQVKAALVKSATLVAGGTPVLSGAGELNVKAAAAYVKRWPLAPTKAQAAAIAVEVAQSGDRAMGTGSLEAARGGVNLVNPTTGATLKGEVDVHGKPWNGFIWAATSAAGIAWAGGNWNGSLWSGSSWTGASWTSANWTGTDWAGQPWGNSDWDAAQWEAHRWASSQWDAHRWAADNWQAHRWAGAEWF